MSRRRPKPSFLEDGVLVVNKPAGPTSHDVVERLRRRFRPAKLGHTGTLDPFATGVLVLAFNRATRMSNLLSAGDKVYAGTVSLGTATDTGDPTGEVIETAPVPEIGPEQAAAALASWKGSACRRLPPIRRPSTRANPCTPMRARGGRGKRGSPHTGGAGQAAGRGAGRDSL